MSLSILRNVLSGILIYYTFSAKSTYRFQVFNEVMQTYEESADYNPAEWEQYTVFYTAYFTYQWGIDACESVLKSKASKELLETVKTVEFDVIVQDITLTQCFYGLWEVKQYSIEILNFILLLN